MTITKERRGIFLKEITANLEVKFNAIRFICYYSGWFRNYEVVNDYPHADARYYFQTERLEKHMEYWKRENCSGNVGPSGSSVALFQAPDHRKS